MKVASRTVEILVGAIVLIIAINFSITMYKAKNVSFSPGKEYLIHASFDRVDGVGVGTAVSISGIKVGHVVKQNLDKQTYNAVLTMAINDEVKLPVDTIAEIISSSLLGDKYISLVPGADNEMLKNNDKLEFTQSSISFESLISRILFGMDAGKNKDNNNSAEHSSENEEFTTNNSHESEKKDEIIGGFSSNNIG